MQWYLGNDNQYLILFKIITNLTLHDFKNKYCYTGKLNKTSNKVNIISRSGKSNV